MAGVCGNEFQPCGLTGRGRTTNFFHMQQIHIIVKGIDDRIHKYFPWYYSLIPAISKIYEIHSVTSNSLRAELSEDRIPVGGPDFPHPSRPALEPPERWTPDLFLRE
jgi:hypothetical protein